MKAEGKQGGGRQGAEQCSRGGAWAGTQQQQQWGGPRGSCGYRAVGRCSTWLLNRRLLSSACPKRLPGPHPPLTASAGKEQGPPTTKGGSEPKFTVGGRGRRGAEAARCRRPGRPAASPRSALPGCAVSRHIPTAESGPRGGPGGREGLANSHWKSCPTPQNATSLRRPAGKTMRHHSEFPSCGCSPSFRTRSPEQVPSRPPQLPWDQLTGVRLPHTYLPTWNLQACRFKCSGLRTCLKEEQSVPAPRRVAHVLVVQEGLRREVARAGSGRMRAGHLNEVGGGAAKAARDSLSPLSLCLCSPTWYSTAAWKILWICPKSGKKDFPGNSGYQSGLNRP